MHIVTKLCRKEKTISFFYLNSRIQKLEAESLKVAEKNFRNIDFNKIQETREIFLNTFNSLFFSSLVSNAFMKLFIHLIKFRE